MIFSSRCTERKKPNFSERAGLRGKAYWYSYQYLKITVPIILSAYTFVPA